MQYDLIGYALQALEADEIKSIERVLASDAGGKQRLELVVRELSLWRCCCERIDAPHGLAARTCRSVVAARNGRPG